MAVNMTKPDNRPSTLEWPARLCSGSDSRMITLRLQAGPVTKATP